MRRTQWLYSIKSRSNAIILVCSDIALLFESGLGMLQALGWKASHHDYFKMTGTFDNPGPYGGFIAVTAVMALAYVLRYRHQLSYAWWKIYCRVGKISVLLSGAVLYLSAAALFAGLCVLPGSMSRSAWVAFAAGGLMASRPWVRVRRWLSSHLFHRIVLYLAVAALSVVFFLIKKESALGRLHIWRIECLSIAKHPWTGVGLGHEMGAYGDAQEDFFARRQRSSLTLRVAGCPEYAFNDYLGLGMQGGIPALLLSFLVVSLSIVRLKRIFLPAACAMMAYAVFAWGSYPLSVPQLRMTLIILLLLALAGPGRRGTVVFFLGVVFWGIVAFVLNPIIQENHCAKQIWRDSAFWAQMGQYDRQVESIAPLYPELKKEYRYLYDLGYALHKEGRYEESSRYLEEGLGRSSDPMFLNILGKNREAVGDDAGAERFYLRSIHRVPCRLYPRLLLVRLYRRTGRLDKARSLAESALSLPISEHHPAMTGLRDDIQVELDQMSMP